MDEELLSFTNAVRQLGSSIGLTRSAGEIRKRLEDVKTLFRGNLEHLVDRYMSTSEHHDATRPREWSFAKRVPRRKKTSHMRVPSASSLDIDALPSKLSHLAEELVDFSRVCVMLVFSFGVHCLIIEPISILVRSMSLVMRLWRFPCTNSKQIFGIGPPI